MPSYSGSAVSFGLYL